MQIFIGLIFIAASVLQIVLFFKIWGMANNIKKLKEARNGGDYYHWMLVGDMEKAYEANLSECVEVIAEGYRKNNWATDFASYCSHLGGTGVDKKLEIYNARALRTGKPLPEHLQNIEALGAYMEKKYSENNGKENDYFN